MRLVMHLGRAALIFWVAAVMLPSAVQQVTAAPPQSSQHSSSQAALMGLTSTAGAGRDQVAGLSARVHGAEDDVRALVARLRLETERFIAQLP